MNKISLSQGQINDLVVTYELDLTPTWWWWLDFLMTFWLLFDQKQFLIILVKINLVETNHLLPAHVNEGSASWFLHEFYIKKKLKQKTIHKNIASWEVFTAIYERWISFEREPKILVNSQSGSILKFAVWINVKSIDVSCWLNSLRLSPLIF